MAILGVRPQFWLFGGSRPWKLRIYPQIDPQTPENGKFRGLDPIKRQKTANLGGLDPRKRQKMANLGVSTPKKGQILGVKTLENPKNDPFFEEIGV